MRRDISGLAEKIYRRVRQMNETNDVPGVKEIQIDCDWTMRTRTAYYRFLKQLRDMAGKDAYSCRPQYAFTSSRSRLRPLTAAC